MPNFRIAGRFGQTHRPFSIYAPKPLQVNKLSFLGCPIDRSFGIRDDKEPAPT